VIPQRKPPWAKVTARDYNNIVEELRRLSRVHVSGPGVRHTMGPAGETFTFRATIPPTCPGLTLAKIVSISATMFVVYLLDASGNEIGDATSVRVFYQGQTDFDLKTNVIPRYEVGDIIPVFRATDQHYYAAQTFIFVGDQKSIQWAEPYGAIDQPQRAYANFRDDELS